jgi:putative enterotoxin type A
MFIDNYIRQQKASLDYFKNAAKNLQELNKELKQDNDKWEEKNDEYLRKITKG